MTLQIQLKVTIDPEAGSAVFDFAGTGPEIRGCWNAPVSVVHAALIYCLRAMCAVDMPLVRPSISLIHPLYAVTADLNPLFWCQNGGCLVPIKVEIPEGCLLSPSKEAAVCGGNVVTSQRITDVGQCHLWHSGALVSLDLDQPSSFFHPVLRAFDAAAASQGEPISSLEGEPFHSGGSDAHLLCHVARNPGCCNNLTFGAGGKNALTGETEPGWGFYETIAGGSGAGPTWNGTSGVHVSVLLHRLLPHLPFSLSPPHLATLNSFLTLLYTPAVT